MIVYITIFVGLALAWYTARSVFQPGLALALMWSLYPAEQLLQQGHPIFIRASAGVNVLFAAVSILAVLNSLRQGKYKGWRIPPEGWYCLGLFSLAFLSYLWSVSPPTTLIHLKAQAPYLVAFIMIAPLCATDQKQLRLAITTTVFLGAIIMLGHAFSSVGRRGIEIGYVRGEVIEANPLAVASYAGYVGICSLFSIYGRKFSLLVAAKIGILFLSAYVINRSGSRGQLIALVAVSFIWLPVIAKATLKRSTVIAILGSAVILGIAAYTYTNVLQGTGRWQEASVEKSTFGRFDMALRLLEYWVGQGPLTWLAGCGSSSSYEIVGFYPHNVPAEVLAEEGLFGFALFTAFICAVFFRSGKMMFSSNLPIETRVNLGILVAMFCFECILMLKQSSMLGSVRLFSVGMTIGWLGDRLKVRARRHKQAEFHARMPYLMPPADQMSRGRREF